jgi:hypothetical protein
VRGGTLDCGRAKQQISYNQRRYVIAGGITGSSSYDIEFPNGGIACVLRNCVLHGATSQNRASVCYGAESLGYDANHLEIRNNHFKGFSARYLGWPLSDDRTAMTTGPRP